MLATKQFFNGNRDWGFLGSEAPGRASRDQTTLAGPRANPTLPGTVLGRSPAGAATVTAGAAVSGSGATPGNGAMSALSADAGAREGVYQVRITNAVVNGGAFEVVRPDGAIDGDGVVGTAYDGSINFLLSDGSVDFVEDDRIPVTLARAAPNGQVSPLSLTALDGGQIADTILGAYQPAGTGPKRCGVVSRGPAEVVDNMVLWPAGITPDQKKAAVAQLAAKGIIVRLNV